MAKDSPVSVTLEIRTHDGATRYQLVDEAGYILYRGTMSASIAGQPAEGYELRVLLEPTEHAPSRHDLEVLRGRIARARRALES